MNPFFRWLDNHSAGFFYTLFFLPSIILPVFLGLFLFLGNFFNLAFLVDFVSSVSNLVYNAKNVMFLFILYYFLFFSFLFVVGHFETLYAKILDLHKIHLSTTSDFYLLRFFIDKKKQISKITETEKDKNRLIMLRVLSEHLEDNIENIIESGACYTPKSDNYFEYRWNREKNKYTKFNVCWDFIREEAKKENNEHCSRALSYYEHLGKFYHKNCVDGFIPQPIEQNPWNSDFDDEECIKQSYLQEIFDLHLSDKEMKYFFDESLVDEDLLKIYRDVCFLTEARSVKESITG